VAGGHSGVPRYAATLASALDRVATEAELELFLLTTAAGAEAIAPRHIEVSVVAGRSRSVNAGPLRLLIEHTRLRSVQADLLHFFDLTGPILAPRRPFVATIHDASAAHGFRRFHNAYKKPLYPWALRRASAAIAVSAFAKEEAVRYFGGDTGKIVVVHSGPGFSEVEAGADRSPTQEESGYLLYVGNLGVNKNLPLLISAFHRADLQVRLVLAGRPREGYEAVRDAVAAGAARDRIELVTQASDREVDQLYRSASALLLPSTYEGFGFTPLEAMARGCPVIASDIPAIREVSGSGAMLVRADDEPAWVEAMRIVVGDANVRAELRLRGAATVKRYSWDTTAKNVLDVFRSVLDGGSVGPTR
jgi:glycosyltransferase involved in cell wall biosynthesis